jgi:hypothetical protein
MEKDAPFVTKNTISYWIGQTSLWNLAALRILDKKS